MTTQEIAERLLKGPLTPERFIKAKELARRMKRPSAFLEALKLLPDVNEQAIEQAHLMRLSHLREGLAAVRARPVKDDPKAQALQARAIAHLEQATKDEHASHAEWQASIAPPKKGKSSARKK